VNHGLFAAEVRGGVWLTPDVRTGLPRLLWAVGAGMWPPSVDQIMAIGKYLSAEFPELRVQMMKPTDADIFLRFWLTQNRDPGREREVLSYPVSFALHVYQRIFEDETAETIGDIFTAYHVARKMREAGSHPVRLNKYGDEVLAL
jgi:hypothetical protein